MVLIILLCAEQRARLRLCASLACATWLLFGPVYVVALVRVPAVYLTCIRTRIRTYTYVHAIVCV